MRIKGEYPLDWRLCFVYGDTAYFSKEDPKTVRGDDWNDRAAADNAGLPYMDRFPCFAVGLYGPLGHNSYGRDSYSAQEYNSVDPPAPWLETDNCDHFVTRHEVKIYGGITFGSFLKICSAIGEEVRVAVEE